MTKQATTRIILARHGEAAYSRDDGADARGGILTELGRSQARALGDQLRTREISAIVCSELSRATQTADIAAEILDLPVEVRTGLHEYRAGHEAYDIRSLGAALLSWLDGDLRPRILGGERGEEVAQRIRPVLDDVVRVYAGKQCSSLFMAAPLSPSSAALRLETPGCPPTTYPRISNTTSLEAPTSP